MRKLFCRSQRVELFFWDLHPADEIRVGRAWTTMAKATRLQISKWTDGMRGWVAGGKTAAQRGAASKRDAAGGACEPSSVPFVPSDWKEEEHVDLRVWKEKSLGSPV